MGNIFLLSWTRFLEVNDALVGLRWRLMARCILQNLLVYSPIARSHNHLFYRDQDYKRYSRYCLSSFLLHYLARYTGPGCISFLWSSVRLVNLFLFVCIDLGSAEGQRTSKEKLGYHCIKPETAQLNQHEKTTNHLHPAVRTPAANMLPTEIMLAHENVAIPLIPWPEVHPPASLDPKAIIAPPRTAVDGETRCDDACAAAAGSKKRANKALADMMPASNMTEAVMGPLEASPEMTLRSQRPTSSKAPDVPTVWRVSAIAQACAVPMRRPPMTGDTRPCAPVAGPLMPESSCNMPKHMISHMARTVQGLTPKLFGTVNSEFDLLLFLPSQNLAMLGWEETKSRPPRIPPPRTKMPLGRPAPA